MEQVAVGKLQQYSASWRESRACARMRIDVMEKVVVAGMTKEDVLQWRQDAMDDLKDRVRMFGEQCEKLRKMLDALQAKYAKLDDDYAVRGALAAMSTAQIQYKLGLSPDAKKASRRLEKEEGLLRQLKHDQEVSERHMPKPEPGTKTDQY